MQGGWDGQEKQRYKLFNLFSRRCRFALAILISDTERLASTRVISQLCPRPPSRALL